MLALGTTTLLYPHSFSHLDQAMADSRRKAGYYFMKGDETGYRSTPAWMSNNVKYGPL